jgi:hypothetical protein
MLPKNRDSKKAYGRFFRSQKKHEVKNIALEKSIWQKNRPPGGLFWIFFLE